MTQEEVVAVVIDAIERSGLRYMLTGSFASNFHGVPRMTQDADVVVDGPESSMLRMVGFLGGDFYVSEDAAREACRHRGMFNAVHLGTGFKVDLVVRKDRSFSEEELRRSVSATLGGRQIRIASPEDTILSKLEWARDGHTERPYLDAAGILEVQGEGLDWSYLDRWADDLRVADLLSRLRSGEPFA